MTRTPVLQVMTMFDIESIRLTQFAKRAGCAAKQPPDYLLSLLARLPPIADPNVLGRPCDGRRRGGLPAQ